MKFYIRSRRPGWFDGGSPRFEIVDSTGCVWGEFHYLDYAKGVLKTLEDLDKEGKLITGLV